MVRNALKVAENGNFWSSKNVDEHKIVQFQDVNPSIL